VCFYSVELSKFWECAFALVYDYFPVHFLNSVFHSPSLDCISASRVYFYARQHRRIFSELSTTHIRDVAGGSVNILGGHSEISVLLRHGVSAGT
jgi:hypothetical protein